MRRPPCICGECKKCKDRAYYQRNRVAILERVSAYRAENREDINEWFRQYRAKQKSDFEWAQAQLKIKRAWATRTGYDSTRDREKIRARRTVQRLVREGKIVRGDCEVCGEPDAQAHHDDYSKALEIKWFCPQHHADYHRGVL